LLAIGVLSFNWLVVDPETFGAGVGCVPNSEIVLLTDHVIDQKTFASTVSSNHGYYANGSIQAN